MSNWVVVILGLILRVISTSSFGFATNLTSNETVVDPVEILEQVEFNVSIVEFVRSVVEKLTVETDEFEVALNASLGDIADQRASASLFCQVVQLKNVYYYYGVIGNQYNYGITSLGSCLYHCVVNNYERRAAAHGGDHDDEHDCRAVNYFSYHKACQLLNAGMESLETADRRTYGHMNGATHAYIQSCYGPDGESSPAPTRPTPPRPPSSTVRPPGASTPSSSGSIGCGQSVYPPFISTLTEKQRIIRGQEARAHSWPWVILYNLNLGNMKSFCGATLLRLRDDKEESDVVLTAAHCVTRPETQGSNPMSYDANSMSVVAGDHRRFVQETGEVHRRVVAVRFHSRFRFTPQSGAVNDLALLKLQSPIRFNDVIRPACLPTQNDPIPSSSLCVAAGWGRNDSRFMFVMPDALQQLTVPVQDANTCRNGWGGIYSEREMICAGTLSGTASTCQGDSGGMLACKSATTGRWVQHGVTSFGVGGTCLEPYKPAVFTRVSSYVDWIRNNAQSLSTLTSPETGGDKTGGEFEEANASAAESA